MPFTVAAGQPVSVQLELVPRALVGYTIHDDAGRPLPAKITIVGPMPSVPDRRFRDVIKDPPPYGVAAWLASLGGDSTLMTRFDHPIPLVPGKYRVVVSRGPEWSTWEKQLDLSAGGATLDATLARVVDTSGYVAADFHQHTNKSPDSPVPVEDRVVTNLADGVEYISTSEHDVLYDLKPIIDSLGAGDWADSGVGVESTPFDYGHFIAWPLSVDGRAPNGGALDWGNGGRGDLSPQQIFDGLKGQGARVVQVNHPRTPPLGISYQQNFDRAALSFDFATRAIFSDTSALEVSPLALGLVGGAPLFSTGFDAVEVYLGFWPADDTTVPDRERQDVLVNTILRDWFDFLSFGLPITATGDSDTHQRWSVPAGMPRTMVRVPDDSMAAIRAGVGGEVARTISGQARRDVVVTNGPMIRMWIGPDPSAGIGSTVALPSPSAPIALHVAVQAAPWARFDTIELYANATFTVRQP